MFENDDELMTEMQEEATKEQRSLKRDPKRRIRLKSPKKRLQKAKLSRGGPTLKKRKKNENTKSVSKKPAYRKLKRRKRVKNKTETETVSRSDLNNAYKDDRPTMNVSERPTYHITDDIFRNHLSDMERPVFKFGNKLVQVTSDNSGRLYLEIITADKLKGMLDRKIRFEKSTQSGVKTVPPPLDVVKDILCFGGESEHIQPLQGISESPIVRIDGTIVTSPGYDMESSYFIANNKITASLKVPNQPTDEDIENAKTRLLDILYDFPFTDEASQTNAIGLLISLIIRSAIDGLVPMTLVVSSQKGTGKGLFTNTGHMIATGKPAQTLSMVKSDAEFRKQLTAVYREGRSIVVYDNISDIINSPVLASALTSSQWSDRTLGQSRIETYENKTVWIANGNNIQLGGDIARRCVLIDFDPKDSKPWLRTEFKYKNLLSYVKKERSNLLSAILTIVRGWYIAGEPSSNVQPLGSYEEWTRVIGGILEWAGFDDFLGNMDKLYEESDSESVEFELFLNGWLDYFGDRKVTAKQICESRVVDLIPGESLGSSRGNLPQRVGRMFGSIANTRFGNDGLHICKAGLRNNTFCWQVATDTD